MKKGIRYDYPKKSYIQVEYTEPYNKLYSLIKEKRDNARLELDSVKEVTYKHFDLRGQICAYNDVLSLMESMFEVKQ